MRRVELEGQLSLFDLDTNIPKVANNNLNNPILNLKVVEINKEEIELNDTEVLSRYRNIENLNRIISYCGGGYGIEIYKERKYITLYINRVGEKEFEINNRCPVLPMDKILFTAEALNYNKTQEEVLKKYKNIAKKIIKRKGDGNIILILKDGQVLSINNKGWVLEFKSKAVYEENEIIFENLGKDKINRKELKKDDKVVVFYDNCKCKGVVRSKHSIYEAYSIDFEKQEKMCNTTFHISQVEVC
ncbi:hypothetical protein [Clostridium ihumii]|uniref:hypothetical protein n=1 Tax=Clostridium ihumii TaxID=1470356 RepID=UPI00068440E0|nr:hypothetical protein [Clostridium ihumii]